MDSVVLIYKSQVEVAFREQTAGHNALLLFVHLALGMMEEQVLNEYKELEARRAEVSHCQCCLPLIYCCPAGSCGRCSAFQESLWHPS